ncbi:hypothetical protein C8F04DRAFT_1178843 [Mycena alexandri]|uniref:Uncharacterized protein n=1 Tax=Mycena alexandri TaxID=1745969 RepID=A0AAD6XBL1_9AGAR|nr:hypothetical protein C8F04DRAFT_1178843 [Mycena alexandri]
MSLYHCVYESGKPHTRARGTARHLRDDAISAAAPIEKDTTNLMFFRPSVSDRRFWPTTFKLPKMVREEMTQCSHSCGACCTNTGLFGGRGGRGPDSCKKQPGTTAQKKERKDLQMSAHLSVSTLPVSTALEISCSSIGLLMLGAVTLLLNPAACAFRISREVTSDSARHDELQHSRCCLSEDDGLSPRDQRVSAKGYKMYRGSIVAVKLSPESRIEARREEAESSRGAVVGGSRREIAEYNISKTLLYFFGQIDSHLSHTPLLMSNFGRGHASPGPLSNLQMATQAPKLQKGQIFGMNVGVNRVTRHPPLDLNEKLQYIRVNDYLHKNYIESVREINLPSALHNSQKSNSKLVLPRRTKAVEGQFPVRLLRKCCERITENFPSPLS